MDYCNNTPMPESSRDKVNAAMRRQHLKICEQGDHVDLMVDEFKRIKSCPGSTPEIQDLCDRAISTTVQKFPLILQRDEAALKLAKSERRVRELTHAIEEVINDNLELADGDVCTLKPLKDAIGI